MRQIKCIQCGGMFYTNSWNASLCSKECRRMRQIEVSREARRIAREEMKEASKIYDGRKKKTEKHKSTMKQLTNDAIEANKMGVTYGIYISRYKGKKRV